MRLSKVLLFVISLVLVVGIAQAKIDKDGALIIPKTSIAPAIDGKVDAIWNLVDATWMEYSVGATAIDDWSNFSGWVKLMYDDQNIYGLFYVQDDVIDSTINGASYQWDGTEFFFDPNNTHAETGSLTFPAHQYLFKLPNSIADGEAGNGRGGTYAWKLLSNVPNDSVFSSRSGYQVEFTFPLDSIGITTPVTEGTPFSFQLQVDDNDLTSALQVHASNWWYSPGNTDWYETLNWGDAKLGPAIPPTGVKQQPSSVVNSYKLNQNYPNPFNPSTEISFTLAKSEKVKLAVYNLLGEQVAVLVNGMKNAGPQTVTFNAKNFSSGVYFYKLEAGSTVLAKKMMLLK
jgi:hypothetical protein